MALQTASRRKSLKTGARERRCSEYQLVLTVRSVTTPTRREVHRSGDLMAGTLLDYDIAGLTPAPGADAPGLSGGL